MICGFPLGVGGGGQSLIKEKEKETL